MTVLIFIVHNVCDVSLVVESDFGDGDNTRSTGRGCMCLVSVGFNIVLC